jgi:zinc transport system substrate-binding protein
MAVAGGCSPSGAPSGEPAALPAPPAAAAAAAPLVVYTVNYPLAYFAERIGGEHVEVVFPAPPDVDPAEWSPDAETIARFQAADLILLNGADYAKWVPRASLPPSRLVDTSASLRDRLVPLEGTVTHSHGPQGEHTHSGWASTLWLDPTMALEQGGAIRDALAAARPEAAGDFDSGLEGLARDLRRLDEEQAAALAAAGKPPVLFSHPVYQYLAGRYELDSRSLHWEPGEAPGEDEWRRLEALLAERPATAVLWEGEPLPEVRRRLEERGLVVLVYEPAAKRPAAGDWLTVMRANAERLAALAGSSTGSGGPG